MDCHFLLAQHLEKENVWAVDLVNWQMLLLERYLNLFYEIIHILMTANLENEIDVTGCII